MGFHSKGELRGSPGQESITSRLNTNIIRTPDREAWKPGNEAEEEAPDSSKGQHADAQHPYFSLLEDAKVLKEDGDFGYGRTDTECSQSEVDYLCGGV